jgi:hypothetical protein
VNPRSTSSTELGTQAHPYKDLESVFVELMNFHSHSDRNITVYIMESSTVFASVMTHITNITQVHFESYSEVSITPSKARIVGVKHASKIVVPSMPTKFNILSKDSIDILADKSSRFAEKVTNNASISAAEQVMIISPVSVFKMYRSGVSFVNLFLTSDYDSSITLTPYFFPIYVLDK